MKAPSAREHKACLSRAWILLALVLWTLLPASATTAQKPSLPPAREAGNELHQGAPPQDLDDVHTLLFRANQAYLEGRYEEAAGGYELLLERGHLNGHVLFNLGNTYVRLGELGKAILHYKKAKLLLPRDGDLKANLQYARSLTKDRIEPASPPFWHTLSFWYFGMSFRELLIAFVFLNALFWCSALYLLYRNSEWAKWGLWLSLLLSLVAGISAGVKYRQSIRNRGGVLLAEESPVRSGFSRNDTTLFVLHEGAEFTILDQEKGWWKIELQDGKKGWVTTEAGGRVALRPDQPIAR